MAGELTFKTYSPLKKGEGYEYTFKASNSALSKVKNLCLHAWKIEFELSEGAAPIRVEAPIPNHLDSLIQKLGK